MTAKEAYTWYQFPYSDDKQLRFWKFVEESTHNGPLIQSLRQNLRDWWQSLSVHEKLALTEIPLPLLQENSRDWQRTSTLFEP